jgi:hypothetical protein
MISPALTFEPSVYTGYARVDLVGLIDAFEKQFGTPGFGSGALGVLTIGDAGKQVVDYLIKDAPNMIPNSFTDVGGITYSWIEGNGW